MATATAKIRIAEEVMSWETMVAVEGVSGHQATASARAPAAVAATDVAPTDTATASKIKTCL
jgi:hypothetical protein